MARLRDHGFTVVVTDHHGVPESGPPPAAGTCVNPVREDSQFPDPYIASVHMAWLLCCGVRQRLILAGLLPASTPKLGAFWILWCWVPWLIVWVWYDPVITRRLSLEVWHALYVAIQCRGAITAATLGFQFAPVINARGRLDSALGSVELLMSDSNPAAEELAMHFVDHNLERKGVQVAMLDKSMPEAARQVRDGAYGITIFDSDGHPGMHGIYAARLVEAFGRPVAYFSPKAEGIILPPLCVRSRGCMCAMLWPKLLEHIPQILLPGVDTQEQVGSLCAKKGWHVLPNNGEILPLVCWTHNQSGPDCAATRFSRNLSVLRW